ncbi:hypothetical protein C3L33_08580, partial [Rhododendron williamsianum]
MERPSREAIETIMSITGVSEVVAAQKLEENWGDLNDAINAHFAGDRNTLTSMDAPRNVATNIDDHLNPFSHVDSDLRRSLWDSGPDFTSSSPIVSHSGEVGEIPIEVKDGTEESHHSVLVPNIDGFSGKSDAVRDTSGQNGQKDDALHDSSNDTSRMPSSPGIDDFDDSNDIEEEMIRAAIEASRRDRGKGSLYLQRQYLLEDAELEEAVLLSLKTAEQEKALCELGKKFGASELDTCQSTLLGDLEKMMSLNGRLEMGSSSIQHGTPNLEKQSLLRHRSRHVPSPSVDLPQKLVKLSRVYVGIKRRLAAKEASLPQEPTSDNENQLTIQVRMPDGSCKGRRFLKSDKLQSIFDFIDVGGGSSPALTDCFALSRGFTSEYNQVRPYNQRALSDGETALTLNELGFTSEKEVIFLELV